MYICIPRKARTRAEAHFGVALGGVRRSADWCHSPYPIKGVGRIRDHNEFQSCLRRKVLFGQRRFTTALKSLAFSACQVADTFALACLYLREVVLQVAQSIIQNQTIFLP